METATPRDQARRTNAPGIALLVGALVALVVVLVVGLLLPSSEHRFPVSFETNAVVGRDQPPSASTATTINGSGIPVYLYEGTDVEQCGPPLRPASDDRLSRTPAYVDYFHILSNVDCGPARARQRTRLIVALAVIGLATAAAVLVLRRRAPTSVAEERLPPPAG